MDQTFEKTLDAGQLRPEVRMVTSHDMVDQITRWSTQPVRCIGFARIRPTLYFPNHDIRFNPSCEARIGDRNLAVAAEMNAVLLQHSCCRRPTGRDFTHCHFRQMFHTLNMAPGRGLSSDGGHILLGL